MSTSVAFGMYFAEAALLKLAFIATQIQEKGLDAGVLLALICNGQQAAFLIRWFRRRGYGLTVLVGETRDLHGIVRNGVGVFFRVDRFKPVVGSPIQKYSRCVTDPSPNAASKIGERMLCVALRRSDMSVLNLVAWHGRHNEAGFSAQLDAIDDLAVAKRATLVLGDVNRRACVTHASGATVLGNGDKRWRDCVDFPSVSVALLQALTMQ